MSDIFEFPPYEKEISSLLEQFNATKLDTYRGHELSTFENITGGSMNNSICRLYKAPKLEKIVFSLQKFREKLECYTFCLWPDDSHGLPIFSTFWAEGIKSSYFMVDFYPTADCVCNFPYLEQYLEPLEDRYDQAKKIYPMNSWRDPNWSRFICSPYYISSEVEPSSKESQEQIFDIIKSYINIYHELWEKDEPREADYMKRLIERREGIRKILYEFDPGGPMMENALGPVMAKSYLRLIF